MDIRTGDDLGSDIELPSRQSSSLHIKVAGAYYTLLRNLLGYPVLDNDSIQCRNQENRATTAIIIISDQFDLILHHPGCLHVILPADRTAVER